MRISGRTWGASCRAKGQPHCVGFTSVFAGSAGRTGKVMAWTASTPLSWLSRLQTLANGSGAECLGPAVDFTVPRGPSPRYFGSRPLNHQTPSVRIFSHGRPDRRGSQAAKAGKGFFEATRMNAWRPV